uniref:Transposase n=1 Tax=Angiostrongylus cantonensis TaxID=6313 RepID=A0A0K0D6R8_ANGCA
LRHLSATPRYGHGSTAPKCLCRNAQVDGQMISTGRPVHSALNG